MINNAEKELIFWITLQEEINYPQSHGYAGRKPPFQKFYEAASAKLGHVQFQNLLNRAEDKGTGRPALFNLPNIKYPSFYQQLGFQQNGIAAENLIERGIFKI